MKLKPALGLVLVFLGGTVTGALMGPWHRSQGMEEPHILTNSRAAARNELALLEGRLGVEKIRRANADAEASRLKLEARKGVAIQEELEALRKMEAKMRVAKNAVSRLGTEAADGRVAGLEDSESYRVIKQIFASVRVEVASF